MKIVTRLCAVSALVGLVLGTPGAARADGNSLDDILKAGVIKIAVPQDFPPFGSVGADLKPEGYDVDVANQLAKDLGVKIELIPVTSANRVPYLQTKKVDLVISSLGVTADRAKTIAFSEPYAPYFSGVFGPADVKVAKPADLSGKTIGVARGTLDDLSLTKLAPADAIIKRFDDQAGTTQAAIAGQVQLIASGNVAIIALNKENPGKPLDEKFIIKQSPCSIGLRRGEPDLLQWVNAAIYAHKLDGVLDDLSMKWFGTKLPAFPAL